MKDIKDFSILLNDGEKFYGAHKPSTIIDMRDCVNIMKTTNTLPGCFWDNIKHNHATNHRTVWMITSQYLQECYGDTIGCNKPPLALLEWLVDIDNASRKKQ
jgi:hypothetical protein